MAKRDLKTYDSMRDFGVTAEPSSQSEVKPSKALRFVIQKHAATRLHYDLRLEWEGVFLSWAVTRGPSLDPADRPSVCACFEEHFTADRMARDYVRLFEHALSAGAANDRSSFLLAG